MNVIFAQLRIKMRIYRNRLIKTLNGQQTRPTSAKVREALFNIWQGEILNCCWLDLCAGSGSMSAEALCRGANQVVAIEQNSKACVIIRENLSNMAQNNQNYRILKGNVLTRLKQLEGETFSRIYFDPPYDSPLYDPVLAVIASQGLLSLNGEIAVEHDPKRGLSDDILGLALCRYKVYGHTALTFYHHAQKEDNVG